MLTPKVKAKEFEKYGFKRCKGIPRDSECYYLCVARGCKMIFVSDICFDINDWEKDDPRIHKDANCRYRDNRTALDIECNQLNQVFYTHRLLIQKPSASSQDFAINTGIKYGRTTL